MYSAYAASYTMMLPFFLACATSSCKLYQQPLPTYHALAKSKASRLFPMFPIMVQAPAPAPHTVMLPNSTAWPPVSAQQRTDQSKLFIPSLTAQTSRPAGGKKLPLLCKHAKVVAITKAADVHLSEQTEQSAATQRLQTHISRTVPGDVEAQDAAATARQRTELAANQRIQCILMLGLLHQAEICYTHWHTWASSTRRMIRNDMEIRQMIQKHQLFLTHRQLLPGGCCARRVVGRAEEYEVRPLHLQIGIIIGTSGML